MVPVHTLPAHAVTPLVAPAESDDPAQDMLVPPSRPCVDDASSQNRIDRSRNLSGACAGLDRAPGLAKAEPEAPAKAESQLHFSGLVALVSDYRIAGVTSSGNAAALQVEFDVDEPSGWSAGIWASTIEETLGSQVEVDLYAARAFNFGETEVSIGAAGVLLPGGDNASVAFITADISRPIGPVDATLAVRYAWPQGNIGDDDDFYVSAKARTPIGRLAGAPLTAEAQIGYERGVFAIEREKYDWALSLVANIAGVDVGVSYVDTDIADDHAGPGLVLSLTRSF